MNKPEAQAKAVQTWDKSSLEECNARTASASARSIVSDE